LEKARMAYQSAIRIEPSAGMAVVELGRLNKELKLTVADQIRFFEENAKVVAAYNQAANQLIELYVIAERYQDALKWLKSIHFNSWEGQYDIHQLWEQSNIKQGDIEFVKGNFTNALDCYRLSLTYPENLEVAEQPNAIHVRNNYKIGNALMKKGEKTAAREYYLKVISDSVVNHSAFQIYRGQAYEALGETDKAHKIFTAMLEEQPAQSTNNRNSSTGMFIRSLALGALGKQKEAAELHKAALELNPLVEINAFSPRGSE
jgi:tetratricopeptide (TPR) repeat protein